jgi:hypothetical protein
LDPLDPFLMSHDGHQVELVRDIPAQLISKDLGEVAGRIIVQLGVVKLLGDAILPVLVLTVSLVVVVTQVHQLER